MSRIANTIARIRRVGSGGVIINYDSGQILADALELAERIERAHAALLKVWPRGKDCEHQHAREAFEALGDA